MHSGILRWYEGSGLFSLSNMLIYKTRLRFTENKVYICIYISIYVLFIDMYVPF